MLGISELFKRIQGIQAREVQVRMVIQEAIKKNTGADMPIESISFSSNAVVLKNATSSLRSAIFVKRAAIVEDINKNQTVRKIVDIR